MIISKNNKSASANKPLLTASECRTPNSQSVFFSFFFSQRAEKMREYKFKTMKNEKQSSGTRSRPHETELTTAAVGLWLSGSHSCCEMRHSLLQSHLRLVWARKSSTNISQKFTLMHLILFLHLTTSAPYFSTTWQYYLLFFLCVLYLAASQFFSGLVHWDEMFNIHFQDKWSLQHERPPLTVTSGPVLPPVLSACDGTVLLTCELINNR